MAKAEQAPTRNLSAALFRLEASRSAEDALTIVRALVDWLQEPEQSSLRRAFAVWFEGKTGPDLYFHPIQIIFPSALDEKNGAGGV